MLTFIKTTLSQIEPKDWFLLVAGMAIPLTQQLLSHIFYLYRAWTKTTAFLGTWHSYNWSRRHNNTFWAHEIWNISRSWRLGLCVDMVVDGAETLGRYRGQVTFESGHVLFTVDAPGHPEHYLVRFADCIVTKDTVLRGVFLAPDYDRHILGAAIIATQTELPEAKAKALLSESTETLPAECCVRIRE